MQQDHKKLKYLYGPVHSWRLGMSLGVDPLALPQKICNYDCVYCQLGKTSIITASRKVFVETKALIEEIRDFSFEEKIDYITFSGRGEPTLAQNLGEMIRAVHGVRKEPVAVITNSSLLIDPAVRLDLTQAECVVAKLDADNQQNFFAIDQARTITHDDIIQGLNKFREMYLGKLSLQIMLIPGNLQSVSSLAKICRIIKPDQVELNTPLRACAVEPISREQMANAKKYFEKMEVITAYDVSPKKSIPLDYDATVSRHGQF